MTKYDFSQPWGKFDQNRGIHHLAHHCADVAAVFAALLDLPIVAERFSAAAGEPLSADHRQALTALAYLHDAGKLSPAFQAKVWPAPLPHGTIRNHLEEGWEWFMRAVGADGPLSEIRSAPVAEDYFHALLAHHGRPVAIPHGARRPWPQFPHYDWRAGEARFLDGFRRWFPPDSWRLPPAPRAQHLFAGLLALADWIGSDARHFPFVPRFDPEYGACARRRAAEAIAAIGLETTPFRHSSAPDFKTLTGFAAPRPAQEAVAGIAGAERLVILEAETGSGKTEAALWRFARLFTEGRVDGLYFALPTRAAADQVQRRVVAILRHWLGDDAPPAVLAVPGFLRADEHVGQRLPGWEVLWDDGAPDARRWAAEHATRFLAATVAVGTVDQAMMAALAVKHAPMRAAALSRSLLVIDEVHASDAYMRRILKQLLTDHLAVGGYAMLMSATLGASARTYWLGGSLPELDEAARLPYPAVWTTEARRDVAAEGDRVRRIEIEAGETMAAEAAARSALAAARAGARVLVIRNTVDAAVDTWRALVAEAPGLALSLGGGPAVHHSRFAAEDRRRLDGEVEAALGKARGQGGLVVIGTQTLEQALDIDADFLITDLCPVDVLLQRLGRLHRHARARPAGFEAARALVLCPEGGLNRLARGPAFENGLGAWSEAGAINGIYLDLAGIEATRRMIVERPVWEIPAMNRELVERGTHPQALQVIAAAMGWQDYQNNVLAKALAENAQAGLVVYRKDKPFHDGFCPAADEGRVRTRLGSEGLIVDLPEAVEGPFGAPVSRFTLPPHWSRGIEREGEVAVQPAKEGLELMIGEIRFHYGRAGLMRPKLG
ncbi:MAG: CRISPR-associated helicase Cas3' [Alphaproteobacteria bacterium]|nr:MAG: CRISPR-associated helicase Cas3' [Alphaproteobacteria bacterium]